MDTTSSDGESTPADRLGPGDRVGPYVILEHLGRGGMGQVYLGTDPRLRRKVALKSLISQGDRPGGLEEHSRILHEARAAARVSHPNIAAVHDVLEHHSRTFIVMEYVEGESLADRLKRGPLPYTQVISMGRQLAAALAAAHAKGIVHRDLKPGNIQIALDGTVKVLDFGLASATISASPSAGTGTTSVADDRRLAHAGTPGYMAPEQIIGRAVDERADIFSLGVVLFEMSTRQRLFPQRDPLDLVAAMRPPVRRADAVAPDVPRQLADVIARAVEIDLRARFQTAGEVGAALAAVESAFDPNPASAHLAAARERPWLRTVVRAAAAIAAGLVILTLLGFLNTAAFNLTLQRTGRFAREPLSTYLAWGIRGNLALVIFAVAAIGMSFAARFAFHVLAVLPPFAPVAAALRVARDRVVGVLGLDDPIVMAQGLAALGVLSIGVTLWIFRDIALACLSNVSLDPPEQLRPLAPDNQTQKALYRIVVNALILLFGAGLFRIVRLRTRLGIREGAGTIAAVAGMFVFILLMHEVPHRIMWIGNQMPKVEVAGERCYVLGEEGNDRLVYCPDMPPPRNRVIRRTDPTVRDLGVTESIFTVAHSKGAL